MTEKTKNQNIQQTNPPFDDSSLNGDKIEGRNPVIEAMRAGREIDKLFVRKSDVHTSLSRIVAMARDRGIVIIEAEKQKLDSMSETGVHQGVIAFAACHAYVSVDDILAGALQKGHAPLIVVCDKITDPHNLGSVIRSADCFGADGVIIPKRNSVGLTATVAKASAGAVEYMPVAKVTNIAQTLDLLKKKGLWIAGADMDGQSLRDADLSGPLAIVIGNEGEGIGRLVREKCDFIVSIPMCGNVDSLNASVAGGILLYEASKRR